MAGDVGGARETGTVTWEGCGAVLAEGFPEEAAWAARVPMTFPSSNSTPALGFCCSPGDSCQSGVARPVPGCPPEPRRGVADSEVWATEPHSDGTGLAVLLGCSQCRSTARCGDMESGGGKTSRSSVGASGGRMSCEEGKGLVKDSRSDPTLGCVEPARAWGRGATGYKAQGEWDVGPQDRAHGRGLASRGVPSEEPSILALRWSSSRRGDRHCSPQGAPRLGEEAETDRDQAAVTKAVLGRGDRRASWEVRPEVSLVSGFWE